MNITKPSILPGFMELLPTDQVAFNRILGTIEKTYKVYGFLPIDTPIIEKTDILLAKGGGETEKQIYRFTKGDTDMSLRFDLTVPLARYVAQHASELVFPFPRYQIGKVFRGERNQKGRFREFYQCDIDIIGQGELSLANDAEIINIIHAAFHALGFDKFTIRVNNRKILKGFFDALNIQDSMDVLRILDKLDKMGCEKVTAEMLESGLGLDTIEMILNLVQMQDLSQLDKLRIDNDLFQTGVSELRQVMNSVPDTRVRIDLGIARGLDYYTGTVFETSLDEYPQIGSVCSGGRYDDLAGYYTNQKFPGVGASIGLTRLFYQLKEIGFLGINRSSSVRVLVVSIEDDLQRASAIITQIREQGIPSRLYTEKGKLAKKLNHANKLGIPWVILIGDKIELKNMLTGEQRCLGLDQMLEQLKSDPYAN